MSFNRDYPYNDEEDGHFHPSHRHFHHSGMPIPVCPKCHSLHVETRNRARKLVGAIGAIAGSTSAMLMAAAKARANASLAGGPVGIAIGGIASTVISALVSGATSGTTGIKLGEVIDEKILNNYLCHGCGHTFNLKHS